MADARDKREHLESDSRNVARAAVLMALTRSREEEKTLKAELLPEVSCAAVDCGGEFITSVTRIVERAVVAAKREGLILESHLEEGGGKIGIARSGDHIVVAVFFGIGLLHLNEVAIALGHRVV